jgi:hypothetical protein
VCVALAFELRASCLFVGVLPLESLHQPFFVLNIYEIASHELFAQAGLEL